MYFKETLKMAVILALIWALIAVSCDYHLISAIISWASSLVMGLVMLKYLNGDFSKRQ